MYTIQYIQRKDFTADQWKQLTKVAEALLEPKNRPSPVASGSGFGSPSISLRGGEIIFNGHALEEGEAGPFALFKSLKITKSYFDNKQGFGFITTEMLPYNDFVIAVLAAARAIAPDVIVYMVPDKNQTIQIARRRKR